LGRGRGRAKGVDDGIENYIQVGEDVEQVAHFVGLEGRIRF